MVSGRQVHSAVHLAEADDRPEQVEEAIGEATEFALDSPTPPVECLSTFAGSGELRSKIGPWIRTMFTP